MINEKLSCLKYDSISVETFRFDHLKMYVISLLNKTIPLFYLSTIFKVK